MIVGIGHDIASVERLRAAMARHGDRFTDRILTRQELEPLRERYNRAEAIAGRFAAKEAARKALGGDAVAWHDVQVLPEPSGAPRLLLSGDALSRAQALGASRWFVSITHDAGVAAAVVILEGQP